jgi:hypothetical protein
MRIARHAAKLVPGQVQEQYKSREGRLIMRRAEAWAVSPSGAANRPLKVPKRCWIVKMLSGGLSRSDPKQRQAEHAASPLQQEHLGIWLMKVTKEVCREATRFQRA